MRSHLNTKFQNFSDGIRNGHYKRQITVRHQRERSVCSEEVSPRKAFRNLLLLKIWRRELSDALVNVKRSSALS